MKVEFTAVGPAKVTQKGRTWVNRKERRVGTSLQSSSL